MSRDANAVKQNQCFELCYHFEYKIALWIRHMNPKFQ